MPPPASAGFSAGASTPECAVAWAGRGPHVVPTSLTWRNPHQALLAPAPASCDSPPAAAPGPARPAQPSAGEHGAAPARGRAGCPVLGAQPRAPHRPPVPALLFLAGRRPLPSGKVSPARCWGWGGGRSFAGLRARRGAGGARRSSERLSAAPPAAGNGEPRAERRRWAASGAKRRPPRGPSLEPGSGGARLCDPGGERLRESRAAPPEPVCLWLSGLGREDPGNVVRCSPDTSVNGTVPTDGRGKKEKKSLKS